MSIYDMHCDILRKLWEDKQNGRASSLLSNEHHVDLQRMRKSGYGLQCFAAYVNQQKDKDPSVSAREQMDIFFAEMDQNKEMISPVYTYEDILENESNGKMSGLLTIEGAEACKGDLANLENYFSMGVRIMTLTWNFENELGFPNIDLGNKDCKYPFSPDTNHGLKEKGIEFVHEMERLGMMIDVSHLSDAGFYDVAKYTKRPFLATHSNARAIASFVRNLDDEMIRTIALRGGVVGINYCADFLYDFKLGEISVSRISDMIKHMKHIIAVGGEDVLGLGSDFDGIDGELEIAGCGEMDLLIHALERADLTPRVIDKILCGNVKRVFREFL